MSKNQTAGDFTGGLPHDEAVLLNQAARSGCLGSKKSERTQCDQEGDDPRFAANNGLQLEAMIPVTHAVPDCDLDSKHEPKTTLCHAQMVS